MKLSKWNVLWGFLMVIAGGLLLFEALGALAVGGLIWSVLFATAGVAFLYGFIASHENWWAIIPGGAGRGRCVPDLAQLRLAPEAQVAQMSRVGADAPRGVLKS